MDVLTTTFILAYGIPGGISLGITIPYFVAESRAEKIAPKLDLQYGSRIQDNLQDLEAAVNERDFSKAATLVQERSAILKELRKISSQYLRFAAPEIKFSVNKGKTLVELLE